ncbi:hypothetical protein OKW21_004288 [Catalinimonas alkaloidigena]|nr:hypothetical protein [Catalinimonas alkaloidigena]
MIYHILNKSDANSKYDNIAWVYVSRNVKLSEYEPVKHRR